MSFSCFGAFFRAKNARVFYAVVSSPVSRSPLFPYIDITNWKKRSMSIHFCRSPQENGANPFTSDSFSYLCVRELKSVKKVRTTEQL